MDKISILWKYNFSSLFFEAISGLMNSVNSHNFSSEPRSEWTMVSFSGMRRFLHQNPGPANPSSIGFIVAPNVIK